MRYRTLGKTGLRVSVIGVGTWQFGGEWGHDYTQSEADEVLNTAKEEGINLIDTAECYGDHVSESLIGNWLKNEKREDWIVASKFGHKYNGFLEREQLWSPEDVRKQLEDSLKALQTDYIDLYQFHSGNDEQFKQDDLWEMLGNMKAQGKVRHLGISITGDYKDVCVMGQISSAPGVGAESIQVIYNRLDQRPEDKIFPVCRQNDLGVLSRVPLASGFLTGKYQPGDSFTGNDVRAGRSQQSIDQTLRQVQQIQKREVPDGVSMAQWALAWCLKHPAVSTVIPGCKNPEQVRSNAAAADMNLRDKPHPQDVD